MAELIAYWHEWSSSSGSRSRTDLEELVRIVGQAIRGRWVFNRAYFSGDQQDWNAHTELRRRYKYSVLAALKKGWKDYCEGIESYSEAARLNRILAGKPGDWLESVRLPNGDYAEAAGECLKLLLKTRYPGFWEGEEETRPRNRRTTRTSWEMARKIFTPDRIR